MTDRRQQFIDALASHGDSFDVRLADAQVSRLADYFELVERWNARLHLVAPCSPREFAVRHVLESLFALKLIPHDARVVDVGTGAGLPAIPCLVVREDLRATLIEASTKKTIFLREATSALNLRDAASIVNARFEETDAPDAEIVTCRALERFTEMLPRLVAWSPSRATPVLFGGASLREEIEREGMAFESILIPESERRFLFVIRREP
jgi:16S rRNA (guanine527-N7)-methyltransferase